MTRLFFSILCLLSFSLSAQDATPEREIPDTCIFAQHAVESKFNSILCLDTKFRVNLMCPIQNFNITIFDSNGKQVFFSTDSEQFWYVNQMDSGIYSWRVNGIFEEGGVGINVHKKGTLAVVY